MISPLLRKRRITRRAASTLARRAASGSSLALLLLTGVVQARDVPAAPGLAIPPVVTTNQTYSYSKKALPPGTAVPTPGPSLAPGTMPAAPLPPMLAPGVQPVRFQPPLEKPQPGTETDEAGRSLIQVDPPGRQQLFKLESEQRLFMRIEQEARERKPSERIVFPDEPVVSREHYDPFARNANWPQLTTVVEPNYVCYRRLLFEQRNAERYGWDLGPMHPFISAGVFVKDMILMPYHYGTAPCRRYECSAGYCLPGDPVPLLLYPPELSLTGLATQAAVTTAIFVIFP